MVKDNRLGMVRAIRRGLAIQPPKRRFTRGRVKQPLYGGYGLRTAARQKASLGFIDGSVLHMNQRTDLIVRSPNLTILQKGEVDEIVTPGTNHMVQTNAAVAGAIGTNFDVQMRSANTVVITVVEGAVLVKNARGSVVVKTGQKTTVTTGKTPSTPARPNSAQQTVWVNELPAPGPSIGTNLGLDANGGGIAGFSSRRPSASHTWDAGNIIDGRLDRGWATGPISGKASTREWVKIALNSTSAQTVTEVVIDPAATGGLPPATDLKSFEIWASTTGTAGANFRKVTTGTTLQQNSLQRFPLRSPVQARYVEIVARSNYGSLQAISVAEVEFVGPGTRQVARPAWQSQTIPNGSGGMWGITCLPASATYDCWGVGQSPQGTGIIIATSDGGAQWSSQTIPSSVHAVYAVSCISVTRCWAVGDSAVSKANANQPAGVALATSDGGRSWRSETVPAGITALGSVSCVGTGSGPHCWASDRGPALVSWSGGLDWRVLPHLEKGTGYYLGASSTSFINGSDGWVGASGFGCGGPGKIDYCPGGIYATTNGGSSWTFQVGRTEVPYIASISCLTSSYCWAVGNTFKTGAVYGTSNGGRRWSREQIPSFAGFLTSISCARGASAYRCWAAGTTTSHQGVVLTTSDSGGSWSRQTLPSGEGPVWAVTAADASHSWAAGQNPARTVGKIIATTSGAAPVSAPTPAPTPTATLTRTTIPTPTPTPTNAPTPSPTIGTPGTPAPTPAVTPTPTAAFSVVAARVAFGSANPATALTRASLTHISAGQRVKLILYVMLSGITGTEPAAFGLRVASSTSTVYFLRQSTTLTPSQNGTQPFWGYWTPTAPGAERFTGTFFLGGRHEHAVSPPFSVAKAPSRMISINTNRHYRFPL